MTDILKAIAQQMTDHCTTYRYDDFLYLSLRLGSTTRDLQQRAAGGFLDLAPLETNGGGDCTQLSFHFAKRILEPMGIAWSWLVSGDAAYNASPAHSLIPFRSTAIEASIPTAARSLRTYIGVPLGHLRPLAIQDGAADSFWGKHYRIEMLDASSFRLHTTAAKLTRYREYRRPPAIDFDAVWTNLIRVKETYSITSFHLGVRHYLGYNVRENRVYYTRDTPHMRRKPLNHFLEEFDRLMNTFTRQFPSPHLRETLALLDTRGDALRHQLLTGD